MPSTDDPRALDQAMRERPRDPDPALRLVAVHARAGRRADAARALLEAARRGAVPAAFRRAAEALPLLGAAIIPNLHALAFGERADPLAVPGDARSQAIGAWRLVARDPQREGEWFFALHKGTGERGLVLVKPGREAIPEADRWRAALDHPGLLAIREVGADGPLAFAVRPYFTGEPLPRWVGERRAAGAKPSRARPPVAPAGRDDPMADVAAQPRLPPRAAAEIAVQAARTLVFLHEHGEAHGDVRPETVRVDERGRVVLDDPLGVTGLRPRGDVAPEIRSGGAPTPASDAHALGSLLRWLLSHLDPKEKGTLAPPLQILAERLTAASPAARPSVQVALAEIEVARS